MLISPPLHCLGKLKKEGVFFFFLRSRLYSLLYPSCLLLISFSRSVCALLKKGFMVGFPVHPPWQSLPSLHPSPTPTPTPSPEAKEHLEWEGLWGVPVGTGCRNTAVSSSLIHTETFPVVAGLTLFNVETSPLSWVLLLDPSYQWGHNLSRVAR